jgi:hypothetical protein
MQDANDSLQTSMNVEKLEPLMNGEEEDFGEPMQMCLWSRRQESNLYLALRRRSFYPLNYGERTVCTVSAPRLRGRTGRRGGV